MTTPAEDIDIRDYPWVMVEDTYDRRSSGKHLRSVCRTPNDKVIWDEGRCPGKDVVFLPTDLKEKWQQRVGDVL